MYVCVYLLQKVVHLVMVSGLWHFMSQSMHLLTRKSQYWPTWQSLAISNDDPHTEKEPHKYTVRHIQW